MDKVVFNQEGKEVGQVALNDGVFAIKPNKDVVYRAVRWFLAKNRSGSHSTLNRGKMQGGGKKPWRQKGTGRARAGSSNSPLWVGGARAHGPKPRSYSFKFPKKMRRLAIKSALSSLALEGKIKVFQSLEISSGKTKDAVKFLKNSDLFGYKVLLVANNFSEETKRSFRNIVGVTLVATKELNVYLLLKSNIVVFEQEAIESLNNLGLALDAKEAD